MATYIIGDIHGCYDQLRAILKKIHFDKKKDFLLVTGDLVSKGLYSLSVLRYLKSLGNKVKIVLGNHDLHFLSIFYGIRKNNTKNNLTELLNAPDVCILVDWLRKQKIMYLDLKKKIIMTHAGIFPYWSLSTAYLYAKKIEHYLSSENCAYFLKIILGNYPISDKYCNTNTDLYRFIINTFTRMRYCWYNRTMDFKYVNFPILSNKCIKPWFNFKNKLNMVNYSFFFGHWSALCGKGTPKKIYAMDTGCCWGRALSIMRFEDNLYFIQKCVF
ncbi:symmetrical bis(5'-nucleosyl)-tetraphosphatase [Buchnera aphidicola (Mollitrichosiphum nigrofasciatum)]|uniref:symmetrical bis(5'-nucleosyl)-tetraphosphatase n=1 Tax=Buchnera aphidicola TaxID=9 RepID=UPI0031B83CC2